jgi:hypothetical protein
MKPSNALYILLLGIFSWVAIILLIALVTWVLGGLLNLKPSS